MIGNDKLSAWCIAVFILYVNEKARPYGREMLNFI